jgi:hypothetical protein
MRHTFPIILTFIAFVVSGCASQTSVRHSVHYTEPLATRNAAVLTPEVEVYTVSASGAKERMYDYESHLESVIKDRVVSALQEMNFRVTYLDRRDLHNKKLMDYAHGLRSNYNNATKEIYKSMLLKQEEAFAITNNLGANAVALGSATQKDILIMVDYFQEVKTAGAKALSFVKDLIINTGASANADTASMIIGFIDAKSGAVLWTNMVMDIETVLSSNNFSSQSQVELNKINKMIQSSLKPLHLDLGPDNP